MASSITSPNCSTGPTPVENSVRPLKVQTETIQMTPREQEIAALLLQGNNPREIGEQLGVTRCTVKQHLRILYLRAGISAGTKSVQLVNLLSASDHKSSLPQLTVREKQIAELVLQGYSNVDISASIGMTVQMVKNYLRSVFDKCGVWTRTELAARYRCD